VVDVSAPSRAKEQKYDITRLMNRWSNPLIVCAVLVTAVVLAADAVVSIASGLYLNLGSGVWLALAKDTFEGVFYRPLWNGVEYGGTRYFPVLFVAIATLMRAGISVVAAGVTVSMLGLAAMAAAVFMLLKRLSVPSPLATLGAALATSPYFVHQTAFAVRCEPIAAALAISGLAVLARVEKRPDSIPRELLAAVLFIAAFLTKITCVYAPAAVTLALLFTGRRGAAVRVAGMTAGGATLLLVLINLTSGGRALASFRACALAGSSFSSLVSPVTVLRPLELIATSHLLTVVFLLAALALVLGWRARMSLPPLYLLSAAAITGVIFTSPGTILTSHILDAYVAAIVLVTAVTAAQSGRLRQAGQAALITLTFWAAMQNVVIVGKLTMRGVVGKSVVAHRELLVALNECEGSIVSESPLIPVFAGQRPVVLDPFAFRVVAMNRPDIGNDLTERLRRREFRCVVLEQDPAIPGGHAWYSNVNLTESVRDAILESYRYDRTVAGERFYRALQ
jgi:hypothetical protein